MREDNPNEGNVKRIKAALEKKIQEQRRGLEFVDKERVNTPGSSFQETTADNLIHLPDIVYAELDLSSAQRPFKEKLAEDSIEYAEILDKPRSIIKRDELEQRLKSNFEEIERLETKIKNEFISGSTSGDLNEVKMELIKANTLKHDLQSQLKEIRESLNNEFASHFKRLQNKTIELEERVKYEHGSIYKQLTSELFQTRNAHISLIQKNIEFEQGISNFSKEDLKASAEAHRHALNNEELGLQNKLLTALQEKKDIIGQNLQVHSPGTPDFINYHKQFDKAVANIVDCQDRILILKTEIENQEKIYQSEEVEFGEIGAFGTVDFSSVVADNPLYEQTTQQTLDSSSPVIELRNKPNTLPSDPKKREGRLVEEALTKQSTTKRVQFTESTIERDDLKQKREASEKQNLETLNQEFSTIRQSTNLPNTDQPAPEVDRRLKPSRLAQSFFSTPSLSLTFDQDEKEKINKKRFACKQ